MPWFRCFIRGENFPGELAGETGLVGFYVGRFVEADSPAEAEDVVMAALRADPRLAPPPGFQPAGIARIHFEKITELDAEDVPAEQPGFAWYPMEKS